MRIHRFPVVAVLGALAVTAPAAHATAPGWSTPHTATSVTTGMYATGPSGQGVQLFANGGVPQRTGQLRAIRTDATQGTAVGVNAGGPGFDVFDLHVNDSGRLVAAWTKDLENGTPVSIAAAIGSRTSLPRTASVFATGALVNDLASAIADNGTSVVVWAATPIGGTIASATSIVAATLRSGQAPIVTTVATRTGALVNNLAVGFDDDDHPIVTWNVTPNENGGPGLIGVARGTAPGVFGPPVETTVDPTQQLLDLETFVTGDGGLLLFWTTGRPERPEHDPLQPGHARRRLHRSADAHQRGLPRASVLRGERRGPRRAALPCRLGERHDAAGDAPDARGHLGPGAAARPVGRADDPGGRRRRRRQRTGRGALGRRGRVVGHGDPDPRRAVELVEQPAEHLQPGQPALGRPPLPGADARAGLQRRRLRLVAVLDLVVGRDQRPAAGAAHRPVLIAARGALLAFRPVQFAARAAT